MSYNKKVLSAIDRDLRDQYRSKRYSKSLSATNSVFATNPLFSKPSPRRIYNPNAKYFQRGGPVVKYKINTLFSDPPKYQIVDIETGKSVGVYKDLTIAEFTLERLNGGPSKNIDPGFTPKDSGRPSGRQIDPGFSPKPNNDIEYFQGGGPINTSGPGADEAPVDEAAMNAMMKARLAYEYEKGNPAAKRMVAPVDNPYDFGDGRMGTHYMGSYGNYAIPGIQDVNGTLEMTGPRDNEAIRFDREEDAEYFANENYKRVSPMFIEAELDEEEIQKYVDGGYIVEDLPKAQLGRIVKTVKSFTNPKLPYPKINTNKLGSYPISKNVLPTTVKGTKQYLKSFKPKKTLLLESPDMKFDRVLKDITVQDTPTLVRNFNAAELDKDLLGLKNENRVLGDKGELYGRRTKHFSGTGAGAHVGGMGAGYNTVFIGNIDDIKKASGSHLREISPTDTYFYNSDNVFKLTDKGVYITSDMDTYMRLLNAGKPVKYEVNLMDGSHSNLSKYIGDDDSILKSFDSYKTNPDNIGSLMPTTYPNKTIAFPSSMNSSAAHSYDILHDLEALERLPLFNEFIRKSKLTGNTNISPNMIKAKELGTGEFDTDYSYFNQWINLPKQVREAELQKIKNFYESNVKTGKLSEDAFGSRYENNLEQYQIDYKKIIDQLEDLHKNAGEGFKYKKGGMLPKAQGGGGVKALINYGKKVKDAAKIIKTAVPNKPLIKTTVNSGSDLLQGLSHGVGDLITMDRKFTEIFPITKSQKKGADLLAESALDEGVKFLDDWFYTFDPNLGKVLRPEISDKILDIYEFGDPRNRTSKYFYDYFRPETGEKYNLGSIWDLYDHKAVSPLDNTPVYGVNTFGINQNNPFVFTRNMLRGSTRDILADPSLSDAQKIKLINTRVTNNTLGTNYAHMPDVRLSATDYKRGPYRYDPKHVYETVIHEGTHTGQLLGTPNLGFGKITTKWDPDKGYYYANEDTPIGRFYKSVMPDKDWTGSPNELHAELMVARSRLYDGWKNNPQIKEHFKTDFNTGRTLSIPERTDKIKEWAFNELRNPTNQTLDDLIRYGKLNRFFKKGVTKDEKYKALRYLPGLAIPFALPSLTDDDKPKLQYGGLVNRPEMEYVNPESEDLVDNNARALYTPQTNLITLQTSATQGDLDHENMHALQKELGLLSSDPYTFLKQEPTMMSSDENVYDYYDRVSNDLENYIDNYGDIVQPDSRQHASLLKRFPRLHENKMMSENPEETTLFNKRWGKDMDLISRDVIANKAHPLMYNDPYTAEGEAEFLAQLLGARRRDYNSKFPGGPSSVPIDIYDRYEDMGGPQGIFDYILEGKLQKGGSLELGDEVPEDMVEELKRQGYTIEEI